MDGRGWTRSIGLLVHNENLLEAALTDERIHAAAATAPASHGGGNACL